VPVRTRLKINKPSSSEWELAIDLPLGVVASQLMRIEEQLRLLNMKAADFVRERDSDRRSGAIAIRLERINRALDSIRTLMADIETDIDSPNGSSDAVYSRAADGLEPRAIQRMFRAASRPMASSRESSSAAVR